MRLIDGDALEDKVIDLLEIEWGYEGIREDVSRIIDNVPTIERPHGEWEHWGSPFTDDTIANSIVCSLCKARYVEIEGEAFNFCPNCGTDMRKEGEANETHRVYG